jgi:hypothetical protein
MRGFCAIAIDVVALVVVFCNGMVEDFFGELNALRNFGQIAYLDRSAVLLGDLRKVETVKVQLIVDVVKLLCRKIEGMFDQIKVATHSFRVFLLGVSYLFSHSVVFFPQKEQVSPSAFKKGLWEAQVPLNSPFLTSKSLIPTAAKNTSISPIDKSIVTIFNFFSNINHIFISPSLPALYLEAKSQPRGVGLRNELC